MPADGILRFTTKDLNHRLPRLMSWDEKQQLTGVGQVLFSPLFILGGLESHCEVHVCPMEVKVCRFVCGTGRDEEIMIAHTWYIRAHIAYFRPAGFRWLYSRFDTGVGLAERTCRCCCGSKVRHSSFLYFRSWRRSMRLGTPPG